MGVSWWPSIVPDSHHLPSLITEGAVIADPHSSISNVMIMIMIIRIIYIECNDDNGRKWDVKMKTRTINLNLSAFVHSSPSYIYILPHNLIFLLFLYFLFRQKLNKLWTSFKSLLPIHKILRESHYFYKAQLHLILSMWWMSELPTSGLPTGGQSWVHNYYVFLYIVWGLCGHWVNASVYSITLFQHMSHSLSQHNESIAHTSLYLSGDSRLSCQCICVFV